MRAPQMASAPTQFVIPPEEYSEQMGNGARGKAGTFQFPPKLTRRAGATEMGAKVALSTHRSVSVKVMCVDSSFTFFSPSSRRPSTVVSPSRIDMVASTVDCDPISFCTALMILCIWAASARAYRRSRSRFMPRCCR